MKEGARRLENRKRNRLNQLIEMSISEGTHFTFPTSDLILLSEPMKKTVERAQETPTEPSYANTPEYRELLQLYCNTHGCSNKPPSFKPPCKMPGCTGDTFEVIRDGETTPVRLPSFKELHIYGKGISFRGLAIELGKKNPYRG